MKPQATTDLSRFHWWFFGIVIAFLGLQFYHFWVELHPEWERYQKAYTGFLKQKSEQAPFPKIKTLSGFEVQQIVPDSVASVDRCTSCHIGIDDPFTVDAPQPLTAHPGEYLDRHPPKDFGCTWCHGGDGFAVTFAGAAHTPKPHFEDPIVPSELIESRCGYCHQEREVSGAPNLTRGRRLIDEARCIACHKIPGHEGERVPRIALDGLGLKVLPGWIEKWLQNPADWIEKPRMPHFRFQPEELQNLVAFLSAQKTSDFQLQEVDVDDGDSDAGKILFRESRCITCHSLEGKGGTLSPDLAKIGSKVRPQWLYTFLLEPHAYNPETLMPHFNFNREEALDLTAYMMEEFVSEDEEEEEEGGAEEASEASGAEKTPAVAAKEGTEQDTRRILLGRKVYIDRGCGGCHALRSAPDRSPIGPDLAGIGQRHRETLEFGKDTETRHTLANWIYHKIEVPTAFDPAAKMPTFLFSKGETLSVSIALMALREEKTPLAKLHSPPPGAGFRPQGEVGRLFSKYRCLSCHEVRGVGGTISHAPLDFEGSQVQPEWLVKFLMEPYTIRPMVIERMPKLRITKEEASVLAHFIELVFVDDAIRPDVESGLTSDDATRGKALFQTLGCPSCHILTNSGGYVGPRLANVGARLTAGWVYAWLENPQRFRPATIEPRRKLTEAQLRQLTAYLMTLVEKSEEGAPK